MLEKLPHAVGEALRNLSAALERTVYEEGVASGAPECIALTSAAFQDGGAIPAKYTQDGEKLSPPLAWTGVPQGAAGVVLLIEDPDAPSPSPLVHAIAWALPGADGELAEGALKSKGSAGEGLSLGRNAFLGAAYLPPDPPPGHGPHRYVFQVYALDTSPDLHGTPIRTQVTHAMKGHVIGRGRLIGTYERA